MEGPHDLPVLVCLISGRGSSFGLGRASGIAGPFGCIAVEAMLTRLAEGEPAGCGSSIDSVSVELSGCVRQFVDSLPGWSEYRGPENPGSVELVLYPRNLPP